jgi:hypothetical protein
MIEANTFESWQIQTKDFTIIILLARKQNPTSIIIDQLAFSRVNLYVLLIVKGDKFVVYKR